MLFVGWDSNPSFHSPGTMKNKKAHPEFSSHAEMAEFWETHSLADYWDHTEAADSEVSKQLRHRYLVPVDRELLNRLQEIARTRGVSTESLVNLLLEQRLRELEVNATN